MSISALSTKKNRCFVRDFIREYYCEYRKCFLLYIRFYIEERERDSRIIFMFVCLFFFISMQINSKSMC